MSRNSRGRDTEFTRDERRSRFSEEIPSRVCIGNVNTKNLSHREVVDWMSRYGRVLDVGFFERHILVQFDREAEAKKAIDREKGQSYRGNRYDIRTAFASDGSMTNRLEGVRSRSPPPREIREISPFRERSPIDGNRDRFSKERHLNSPENRRFDRARPGVDESRQVMPIRPEIQDQNFNAPPFTDQVTTDRPGFDAAIIVMSSELLRYAETIEAKLQRQIALTTHIIVLKEEAHANACVEDLTNKGVLYAFLVNGINEKHSSCTLRILYGTPQEHRNMPLASALNFVANNFESYQKRVRELKMIAPKPTYDPSRMPPGFIAPDDKTIYYLHLLADNRMLTIEELEKVIEFVQERIQALNKAENMIDKPNAISGGELMRPNQIHGIVGASNVGQTAVAPQRDEKLIALQNQLHSNINNMLKPSGAVPSGMGYGGSASGPTEIGGMGSGHMSNHHSMYNEPPPASAQPPSQTPQSTKSNNFLTNPSVQKALDNLMHSQFRPNQQQSESGVTGGNTMGMDEPVGVMNRNSGGNYVRPLMGQGLPPSSVPNQMMGAGGSSLLGPRLVHPGMAQQQQQALQSQYSGAANMPGSANTGERFPQMPPSNSFYGQPPLGQPIYRGGRPLFQQRPQYPGY